VAKNAKPSAAARLISSEGDCRIESRIDEALFIHVGPRPIGTSCVDSSSGRDFTHDNNAAVIFVTDARLSFNLKRNAMLEIVS
jgi:hypothetical protein|tara:strand:+ start:350 stop:598 length:249 start_codon:yes stop_codon:yes gene_type:complete